MCNSLGCFFCCCCCFFLLISIEQVHRKITHCGLESVMYNLDTDILVFWKQAMTYSPQYTFNAMLVLTAYFSSIYSYTEFRLDYLTFKLISRSNRMLLTTTLGIFWEGSRRKVNENSWILWLSANIYKQFWHSFLGHLKILQPHISCVIHVLHIHQIYRCATKGVHVIFFLKAGGTKYTQVSP